LGRDTPDIGVVGRRQDRSPVWPDGVTGSITHTRTYTAAAVSRSVRGVGIDTEVLLRPEEIDEIAAAIATEEEVRRAASTFACHRVGITVLFSAKESLFKCLYPIVRTWFDFTHARLAAADAETGVAVVELVTALGPGFEAGWRAAGSVRVDPPYVHTGFLLHRDAQAHHVGTA
jgi:4'-phosphopantetheinyl transferase EntD